MLKVSKRKNLLSTNTILFSLLIIFVSVVYFHNLTHDIFGGDVGDLVTASMVGGIAHPPGYPLFVMLGYFFGHLPIPLLPVTKVGFVSLLSGIGSLIVFKQISKFFTNNIFFQLISTFILAFSYLFWLYVEIPEVFVLNIFLSLLVIFSVLKYLEKKEFAWLSLSFFFFGLGATNHQTIIFTLPLVITALIVRRNDLKKYKYKLLLLPTSFLIGVLPYLYIPIAASHSPIVNWDNVNSLQSFLHLVLRQDYGTFSSSVLARPVTAAKFIVQQTYFNGLVTSLTIPALVLVVIGALNGFQKYRAITITLLISILLAGPFFIVYAGFSLVNNFSIGIAQRFFLQSQVFLLIFLPLGLEVLYSFLQDAFSKKIYAKSIVGVLVLIPILMFLQNFPKTDLSKTRIGTNFAKDYLESLPKRALLLTSGDTRTFNTWYVHYVLNVRPDVHIVQIGNFGTYDKDFSKKMNEVKKETGAKESDVFMNAMLQTLNERSVFAMIQVNIPKQQYAWIFTGFSFQLFSKKDIPTEEKYKALVDNNIKDLHIPYVSNLSAAEHSLILLDIPSYYSNAMYAVGVAFEDRYKDLNEALFYYNKAISIDPTNAYSYFGISRVLGVRGECDNAEDNITKAISTYPIESKFYIQWYEIALNCQKNYIKASDISKNYKNKFHETIENVLKKSDENLNG